MKKRLKVTLRVLGVTILICLGLVFIAYYQVKNADDSRCPSGFHLYHGKLKSIPCSDCNLTKKQIELGEKYISNYECDVKEKNCYLCLKPPLPDCQCTYDFKYVKVNDFVGYLLKLIHE